MENELTKYLNYTSSISAQIVSDELNEMYTSDKIKEEYREELLSKITNGIYSGISAVINSTINNNIKGFLDTLVNNTADKWKAPSLIGQVAQIANKSDNWNKQDTLIEKNEKEKTKLFSDKDFQTPESQDTIVFNLDGEPREMIAQLIPILKSWADAFLEVKIVNEFKMHKDNSVAVMSVILKNTERYDIICQRNREPMDWMMTVTTPEGEVKTMNLQQGLNMLFIKYDL